MARKYGEQVHYPETGTGNSGHFYIERNGTIEQWVPVDRVAHHVRNFNKNSLGIELVNRGRYPQWFSSRHQLMQEPYPPEQVDALLHLLKTLSEQLPSLSLISGHSTLDKSLVQATDNSLEKVYRKQDPGPLFPWPDVLAETSLVWFEPENDL
jgi:N-acetylmuramoyl-L-alanine amidase